VFVDYLNYVPEFKAWVPQVAIEQISNLHFPYLKNWDNLYLKRAL
jgi:hypothetical protein